CLVTSGPFLRPFASSNVVSLLVLGAPRPTLFPYTTLFRSQAMRASQDLGRGAHVARLQQLAHPRRGPASALPSARDVAHDLHLEDRKSTRLNSSHVKISYAVFCLKKKTDQKSTRPPDTSVQ